MAFPQAKVGNVFFQLPEPREVLYGELAIGARFHWKGKEYKKTPFGRQPQVAGRPGKHLPELEIVTI